MVSHQIHNKTNKIYFINDYNEQVKSAIKKDLDFIKTINRQLYDLLVNNKDKIIFEGYLVHFIDGYNLKTKIIPKELLFLMKNYVREIEDNIVIPIRLNESLN